MYITVTGC